MALPDTCVGTCDAMAFPWRPPIRIVRNFLHGLPPRALHGDAGAHPPGGRTCVVGYAGFTPSTRRALSS